MVDIAMIKDIITQIAANTGKLIKLTKDKIVDFFRWKIKGKAVATVVITAIVIIIALIKLHAYKYFMVNIVITKTMILLGIYGLVVVLALTALYTIKLN